MGNHRIGDDGLCLLGLNFMLENMKELQKGLKRTRTAADAEVIHDLRVATRRIRTTLPIFETCLTSKQYRRLKSATREVKDALGTVRDNDVLIEFLQRFSSQTEEIESSVMEALLELMGKERLRANARISDWLEETEGEETIRDIRQRLEKKVFKLKKTNASVRTRTNHRVAQAHIEAHVTNIQSFEGWVHDPSASDKHHQLRIAIKHLRYTLEVFRPLFDDELEIEIQELRELQDALGGIHDCDVWVGLLSELASQVKSLPSKRVEDGLRAMVKAIEPKKQEDYDRFVRLWDKHLSEQFFEQLVIRFQIELVGRNWRSPLLEATNNPTKVAIISDVHGNLDALNAVIDDACHKGATAFFNLGDMIGFGPYSNDIVGKLRVDNVLSIVGNFDLMMVEYSRSCPDRSFFPSRSITSHVSTHKLSSEVIDWLASLPLDIHLSLRGRRVLMVHASPEGTDERIAQGTSEQRLRELGNWANADIVLVGHSHVPMVRTVDGTVFINPGSVGQPKDDDPRASYALLDTSDFHVELHRVEYNRGINARSEMEKIRPKGDFRIRKDETMTLEVKAVAGPRSTAATGRLSTLEGIASRLNLDHDHSLHVRKLAIRLFEVLAPLHKLKAKDLFLLEAGCLLHDLGAAEGPKGHHKTSYRMIMDYHELPLSEDERRIVALLALYHRKKPPQDNAPSLSALTSGDRVKVRKLAALLRIADGLDYRHVGAVTDLHGRVESDTVTLTLLGADGALAEKDKALKKADLFAQVFKRNLVIE